MITIRDVARQAGVSVATVSRVLNNSALVSPDTRDVVMKAVTQLGYRPNANAQALATQVSDTIGVVVMDVSDALQAAINQVKKERNFGILFIPEGKYKISKTIYIPGAIRLIGYGEKQKGNLKFDKSNSKSAVDNINTNN